MSRSLIRNCCVALLAICTVTPTHAGWDPVKEVQKAADKARKGAHAEAGNAAASVKRAHGLNYSVRIANPTNNSVFYQFEGAPQALPPHTVRHHQGSKIGRPDMSFDNGRNQSIEYGLDGNRTFEFQWKNGVLDLVRS